MHCPRCGREQVSGNLKFCSKCGLPLNWVVELVRNEGSLPADIVSKSGSKSFFSRSFGLKLSLLWFIVLDFLLVPLIAILDGGEMVAVVAVLGAVGAILLAVLSVLFLKGAPKSTPVVPAQMQLEIEGNQQFHEDALPQHQQTAEEYVSPPAAWKAPETGELAKPPSVTEGTTKLLDPDQEGS